MARAACALLAIVCVSTVWLACTVADETQPLPVAEQDAFGRVLQELVPSQITYSLENGINTPHIVKYKSVSTHTKKVAEEKEDEAEEEEEPAEPEEGSVGAHAAAFANKPFKRKEPHTIEKSYTQKVTVDHKRSAAVKQDVILKEKPSAVIQVAKEHSKEATVTAAKDR
ncbi:hypothetical protein COO60DRAFT_1463750 [Scenedesmus sp. NREL 46B-D3]|nr:hypothetical protein COO60DRAFT_1463750 [Scenedesmus sp. NREL 46B-D3]